MSNQHKNPTISFRITDAERKQIEARVLASGMMKKDYFVRSCICVVGKKETIYPLVQTVNALYLQLLQMQWMMRKQELRNGEITDAEYLEWKLNWPDTCDDSHKRNKQ